MNPFFSVPLTPFPASNNEVQGAPRAKSMGFWVLWSPHLCVPCKEFYTPLYKWAAHRRFGWQVNVPPSNFTKAATTARFIDTVQVISNRTHFATHGPDLCSRWLKYVTWQPVVRCKHASNETIHAMHVARMGPGKAAHFPSS